MANRAGVYRQKDTGESTSENVVPFPVCRGKAIASPVYELLPELIVLKHFFMFQTNNIKFLSFSRQSYVKTVFFIHTDFFIHTIFDKFKLIHFKFSFSILFYPP